MKSIISYLRKVISGRSRLGIAAALLIATAALTTLGLGRVGSARAASAPVRDPYILIHFDLASEQQPENIAVEPDGSADVTFMYANQIAHVTMDGRMQMLATLPAPAAGAPRHLLTGIVRTLDGTLYVNYSTGTADLTGIWRVRPGGVPKRIAALPADSFANGLALDERTGLLYVADSFGMIWQVPLHGGTPALWASGSALAPISFLGANGIKVHNGAVWVSNTDAADVLRIPIERDSHAGAIETWATGLTGIDDFAFTGDGNTLLAALNGPNQIAYVKADRTHTIVLTAADGLSNPSSVAVDDWTGTVYVPSAAYVTQTDPNLLLAHLDA